MAEAVFTHMDAVIDKVLERIEYHDASRAWGD